MTDTKYFLVAAPGYYGDRTRVISSHRTLDAARRAARGLNAAIYAGEQKRGSEWLRVYEQFHSAIR